MEGNEDARRDVGAEGMRRDRRGTGRRGEESRADRSVVGVVAWEMTGELEAV